MPRIYMNRPPTDLLGEAVGVPDLLPAGWVVLNQAPGVAVQLLKTPEVWVAVVDVLLQGTLLPTAHGVPLGGRPALRLHLFQGPLPGP